MSDDESILDTVSHYGHQASQAAGHAWEAAGHAVDAGVAYVTGDDTGAEQNYNLAEERFHMAENDIDGGHRGDLGLESLQEQGDTGGE